MVSLITLDEKIRNKLFLVLESGERHETSYESNDMFASLTTKCQLEFLDFDDKGEGGPPFCGSYSF